MSNGTYERFCKLLVQVGKLVLDDKRHLESVCAALQRIVFDEYRWPRAKNWHAINMLAKSNQLMASVVGALDLSGKDNRAQWIIAAFPECFLDVEVKAPIPLSIIRAQARVNARAMGYDGMQTPDLPASYGALDPLGIPFVIFRTSEKAAAGSEDFPFLPGNVNAEAKQGEEVEIDGVRYIVLENNQNSGVHEMAVAPVEFVDATC